jgi:hypothetical protein
MVYPHIRGVLRHRMTKQTLIVPCNQMDNSLFIFSSWFSMLRHGTEGKGKNEGGVVPPDITWATLTKPYLVARPGAGSRPRYTEGTLKRAVALGLDSGGRPLQSVMPRFQLSYRDANDLVAFLKKLGRVSDPGLSDSEIRIGVVLPHSVTRMITWLARSAAC